MPSLLFCYLLLRKQAHSCLSRLRKYLRNRYCTVLHRTCNVLRAYGVRLRKHLRNRHRAMLDRVLTRQGGVNARALARRAGGIDSVIVVVANLRHELRLQHFAIADREARRHGVAVDHGHLKAVCAASLQGEVDRRVGNHIRLLAGHALRCGYNPRCAVCVANVGRCAAFAAVSAVTRARLLRLDQAVRGLFQVGICL